MKQRIVNVNACHQHQQMKKSKWIGISLCHSRVTSNNSLQIHAMKHTMKANHEYVSRLFMGNKFVNGNWETKQRSVAEGWELLSMQNYSKDYLWN